MMDIRCYNVLSLDALSEEDKAAAISLQGLLNREEPKLYLLPQTEGPEQHWIDWYKQYRLEPKETTLDNLLASAGATVKGYIIFNPELPDTLNAAMSLAGIMEGVVCGKATAEKLAKAGLPCLADLSNWTDFLSVYRWLIKEYLDHFNLSVMANYDQRDHCSIKPDMDYVVAHKGFCMGLTINEADYPEEAALWDEVQTAAPDGAIMIGWLNPRDSEATHVYFGSRHSVCVYCGYGWNMSFHQNVKAHGEYQQDHCESAVCDPNARYATITLSDGDSWHSMADVQKKFWLNPRRGEVPLGWEVAPIFAEVGPSILDYYFQTRTENDYLVCGPSGIGYNYLSGFKNWKGFLDRSAKAMQRASLKTIWNINRVVRHVPGGGIEHRLKDETIVYTRQQMEEFGGIKDQKGADWVDPEMVSRYFENIPDALGFFQGWERIPGEDPRWVNGKMWCPAAALVRRDVDGTIREFEEAAARQSSPVFVAAHVNCYDADMDSVIEVVRQLEAKGYTVVRPDVFLRLAQNAAAKGLK